MMKKLLLLFCLLLMSNLVIFSQEECRDIIYTAEGGNIIFDCCIQEVKSGNIVYYIKAGDTLNTAAAAITKNGQHIELLKLLTPQENQKILLGENEGHYNEHELLYYQHAYKTAHNLMGTGVILTSVGILCDLAGIIILHDDPYPESKWETATIVLFIGGGVLKTTGIPLWISGAVMKANNKRAINHMKRNLNLTLGLTRDGIGLRLSL